MRKTFWKMAGKGEEKLLTISDFDIFFLKRFIFPFLNQKNIN